MVGLIKINNSKQSTKESKNKLFLLIPLHLSLYKDFHAPHTLIYEPKLFIVHVLRLKVKYMHENNIIGIK